MAPLKLLVQLGDWVIRIVIPKVAVAIECMAVGSMVWVGVVRAGKERLLLAARL